MRFDLIVEINGVKWSVDTYTDEPISLTFNVADINDIASRNSSFSKTIKLPETANNRQVFGDISDLSAEPATFNPNKKAKCWILVDTLPVIEGFIQLRKVFFNKSTGQAELEVVIYADNDNFYKQLGDFNISDLNFSELDHVWNQTNVVQSWTASSSNGYYYPLIDYGQDWELGDINGWSTAYKTYVSTAEMFPATNVKYIWDKIFSNAGYNYQSNFLNSQMFKDLYIPFNKAKITRDTNTSFGRFTVGFTQSRGATAGFVAPYTGRQLGVTTTAPLNMLVPGRYGPTTGPNTLSYRVWQGKIPFTDEASPNGDPNNVYSTTTYEFTAPAAFAACSFTFNFDITFPALPGSGVAAYSTNTTFAPNLPHIWIAIKRSRDPITGVTASVVSDISPYGGTNIPVAGTGGIRRFTSTDIPGIQYSNNNRTVRGQITTDVLGDDSGKTRRLFPGEKVWVEVSYSCPMDRLRDAGIVVPNNPPINSTGTLAAGTTLITLGGNNKLWNNQSAEVKPGELIQYNSCIPANIKQKDFVTSIVRMFNLIIEPSKDNDKTLLIEPRDDYYNAGAIKDWTYKLDVSQPIEEQILGETQNKKTILKYKDDKDFYNEDYRTITGDISYGQYDYYIDNDFITGEKKIETIFSPTPIVGIYNNNVATKFAIPKIVKTRSVQPQEFTDHNIRILTRFSSTATQSWTYGDYQWRDGGAYNAYTTLTSQGFGNAIHRFQVGDYIQVRQNDGGALKPILQGNFQVVEIVNNRTITIDIPFSSVGSGAAVGGVATPLTGLVGLDESLTWQFENTKYRSYPYLGHFDHPIYPSYDINFGQIVGAYYPQYVNTNDNLYEMFYSNMLNEISDKDSRIVRANFYLTALDIANFKFNDKIYINNQYYKVNKIEGYDPTKERLTKVELIKTKFITVPRKSKSGRVTWIGDVGVGNIGQSDTIPLRDISLRPASLSTPGNRVFGSGTIVAGRENFVAANSIVVGRGNIVAAEGVSVIGDNNSVDSAVIRSSVVGDNNVLLQNTTDTQSKFVFGSGNTHSGVGLVYGDSNQIAFNTKNTHLFGSNNIITTPFESTTATGTQSASAIAERIFIIGDGNTISNPTYSAIQDIFIQGTNSFVQSNNATIFGSGVTVGRTASNTIVMADNISVTDSDTILMAKDTTKITSNYTQVTSTASIAGPRLNISSTLTNINTGNTIATFSAAGFDVQAARNQFAGTTFSVTSTNSRFTGSQMFVANQTQFTGRATFSNTTTVSGSFQATGVVNLTGPNTYIANMQSSTNLNSYFS